MSIKYFALQSLAETPGLPESVRDAAKTELREYDAYLAKIFDPEDPASARFLDRAKVVGKIAGKAAKAGGTAYLMLNLMGCYGEGITPTPVELPTITTNPAITETVPAIETPSPTEFQPDLTPSGTETFTETPLPVLSEHPTSEELFAAKQGELPNIFTFGGHKWTAETNDTGEKVWMREDGKVDFEWASLYGGGVYNAYMFVTRSTPAEGKRTLEIYADPRIPYFFLITGSPDEVDTFVGTTVADYLQGAAAKAALKQPGSTLRIISGGIEYWPIGGSNAWRPQDISYYGPNGEILWQKIWGVKFSGSGETGPFVEPSGVAVQCGKFRGPESFFTFIPQYIQDNPIYGDVMAEQDVATAIRYCSYYDPDKTKLTPSGFTPESVPVVKTELIDVK